MAATMTPATCLVLRPPLPQSSDGELNYKSVTKALEIAIPQANLTPLDDTQIGGEEVRDITESLVEMVHQADIVVADIGGYMLNSEELSQLLPMYYLIGLSHAIGNKTILVARNRKNIPAILQGISFLLADGMDFINLFAGVVNRISSPQQKFTNPVQKYRSRILQKVGAPKQAEEAGRQVMTDELGASGKKIIFRPIKK
ncbi:hypothetical protein M2352_003364 [Azospirillum fermentarium]|uniref:hypothetical protein n=1 Tax=Azospirillum fermentarium TaxID=1233114 RepID=UPI0022275918|nr:hypothetical protein [Azospirillum fermentarium]MCW2247730.1 hypothetical protein [Azospirillum fermentarium]